MPRPDDPDSQDVAETFDEENITPDGRDIATSDLQPDLFDATSSDEDADEALAPDDDFDPDRMDEAEFEQVVLAEEDLDEPRSFAGDDGSRVANDDGQPADYEAGEREGGGLDAEDTAADAADRALGRRPGAEADDSAS